MMPIPHKKRSYGVVPCVRPLPARKPKAGDLAKPIALIALYLLACVAVLTNNTQGTVACLLLLGAVAVMPRDGHQTKTTMEEKQLKKTLALHAKWLRGEEGGARADLGGADLSGANLTNARLDEADLSRVNLSGANLTKANLTKANLTGADLYEADLSGADLTNARIVEADLEEAKFGDLGPLLHRATFGRAPSSGRTVFVRIHEAKTIIKAGCFSGTASELRARSAETHRTHDKGREWYAALCDSVEDMEKILRTK